MPQTNVYASFGKALEEVKLEKQIDEADSSATRLTSGALDTLLAAQFCGVKHTYTGS